MAEHGIFEETVKRQYEMTHGKSNKVGWIAASVAVVAVGMAIGLTRSGKDNLEIRAIAPDSVTIDKPEPVKSKEPELIYHVFGSDDLYFRVADKYGMSVEQLRSMNPQYGDGSKIAVGDSLVVGVM